MGQEHSIPEFKLIVYLAADIKNHFLSKLVSMSKPVTLPCSRDYSVFTMTLISLPVSYVPDGIIKCCTEYKTHLGHELRLTN